MTTFLPNVQLTPPNQKPQQLLVMKGGLRTTKDCTVAMTLTALTLVILKSILGSTCASPAPFQFPG